MIRELPLQAAVKSYIASLVPVNVLTAQGSFFTSGTTAEYLQLFDATAVPADGTVPNKVWALAANGFFLQPQVEGEVIPCKNGAVFVLSTTEATKTIATSGTDKMDIQVDVEEFDTLADYQVTATTTSTNQNPAICNVLNAGLGPVKISKAVITPGSTQNLFLQTFYIIPASGSTKPFTTRSVILTSGIPLTVTYGDQGGLLVQGFDSTGQLATPITLSTRCFVGLSTTGNVYTAYTGADMVIAVSYFPNATSEF